jgi:hypothetical protein
MVEWQSDMPHLHGMRSPEAESLKEKEGEEWCKMFGGG